MKAKLDELTVPLSADDRRLVQAFRRSRGEVSAFARKTTSDSRRVQREMGRMQAKAVAGAGSVSKFYGALASGVAIAAVGRMVKRMADVADEIETTAKATGITVEELQESRFAFEQVGIASEGGTKALQFFTKALGQAQLGTGEARRALDELGIRMEDLDSKTPLEAMGLVADRLRAFEDPLRRNAILAYLFGRSGLEMAALLEKGSQGIESLRQRARDLGLVLSEETIRKAAAANAEFKTMGQVMRVSGVTLAAEFLPALRSLVDIMTDPDFQRGVKAFAEGIGEAIEFIANNIETVERLAGAFIGMKLGRIVGAPGMLAGGLVGSFAPEMRGAGILSRANDGIPTITVTKGQKIEGGAPGLPPPAIDPAAAKQAARIQKVIESLSFQEKQLSRTSREQAVYNALIQAGIDDDHARAASVRAAAESLYDAREAAKVAADAQREFGSALEGLESLGRTVFDGLIDGTLDWKSVLKSAIPVVVNLVRSMNGLSATGQAPANGGLFSVLVGGLFGGISVPTYHEGGVVGQSAALHRRVDPRVFDRAPRYHDGAVAGLAPNEVPAILEKNEIVLPANLRSPMRGAAGAGTTINNNFSNVVDGADATAIALIEQRLALLEASIVDQVKSVIRGSRQTNPGLMRP